MAADLDSTPQVGVSVMKYYKTWQEAFKDFIERFGHNYEDSYNLAAEFEQQLGRNIKGVWFLYIPGESK